MAELVAIAFEGPHEADRVLTGLGRLQKEHLIDLEDAVVAIRQPDGRVHLKQSVNFVGEAAVSGGLSGALWGTLVGLLFLNPLAGFAVGGLVGAGAGTLSGSLVDYGIDDDFIRSLASTLNPDNSALFVLIRKGQPEEVLAELAGLKGCILRTSLSPEQEARLQAALSGAAVTGGPMQTPTDETEPDVVEEADLESFPASDPPAWTGMTGVRETRFEHEPSEPGAKPEDPATSPPKVG